MPEYEFDRIRGAIRLSDGRLVIADGGSGELRWYSPTGEHILSVGGPGEGPGEFVGMPNVFWIPGDSIGA